MVASLVALGVEVDVASDPWHVAGSAGALRAPDAPLFTGNSGTTARFLTAAATLADGPVVLDGTARMRERPIDDLTRALEKLGAPCRTEGAAGCPPVRVAGGGLPGGDATIDARRSSQYVSAVLLAAPYAQRDVTLRFENDELVSRPYVDLTRDVMRAFGAEVGWQDDGAIRVTAGATYRGRDYAIEADASSAAYPFCAAAIAGGRVRVDGLSLATRQPDIGILGLLERMGCAVERGPDWAEVRGSAEGLHGIDVDMNDLPDAVLAIAVVALFAEGTTRIRNVANLRIKETDVQPLGTLDRMLPTVTISARSGGAHSTS
jgi:3-phosphoshikimate 1-carboxyvinyltransferase